MSVLFITFSSKAGSFKISIIIKLHPTTPAKR